MISCAYKVIHEFCFKNYKFLVKTYLKQVVSLNRFPNQSMRVVADLIVDYFHRLVNFPEINSQNFSIIDFLDCRVIFLRYGTVDVSDKQSKLLKSYISRVLTAR